MLLCGHCDGDTRYSTHTQNITHAVDLFDCLEGIFGLNMLFGSYEGVFGWMHVVPCKLRKCRMCVRFL